MVSVGYIGEDAISDCLNLRGIYFAGNAPGWDPYAFSNDTNAAFYYLPGTTGWTPKPGGWPMVLWNPQPVAFGVNANQFGFNITGSSNIVVVVEASTDLANPAWIPLATTTLTNGLSFFSDPQWSNFPARFYRFSSP